MALKTFCFQYGSQTIEVSIPEEKIINDIRGTEVEAIADIPGAVRKILRDPIGSPPLQRIVSTGDKVAVVIGDITRAYVQFDKILPALFDELNLAGVSDRDIFVVVALGAHRVNTDEEIRLLCGAEICQRVAIYQHDAHDQENLVYVGTTSQGVKSYINKRVMSADKIILTGGIVYHLMAGFGGGRKAIMPGVSGYESIQSNHRLCLHKEVGQGLNPNGGSGILDTNEMAQDMLEIAAFVKPAFLFNAIFTPEGRLAKFVAGHWCEAWEEGVKEAVKIYGIPVKEKADVVIASGGGYPKDINLYQGVKANDNAFLATKPGGVAIVFMECLDMMEPPEFGDWLKYKTPFDHEMALREAFTVPGYTAYRTKNVIAKEIHLIIITRQENAGLMRDAGIIPVISFEEAVEKAEKILGTSDYTITIMTQAANTVPIFRRA